MGSFFTLFLVCAVFVEQFFFIRFFVFNFLLVAPDFFGCFVFSVCPDFSFKRSPIYTQLTSSFEKTKSLGWEFIKPEGSRRDRGGANVSESRFTDVSSLLLLWTTEHMRIICGRFLVAITAGTYVVKSRVAWNGI